MSNNQKLDRYHGVGGSYTVDPKSHERVRKEGPPIEDVGAPASKPAAARASGTKKSARGSSRVAPPAAAPDATSSDAGNAAKPKE